MTTVTSHYRYKRPPRKKKPVAYEGPAIVTIRRKRAILPKAEASAGDDRKSAIITIKRKPSGRFGDAPDLTPEEVQRRGDAADALWREIKRRIAEKDQS